MRLLILFASFLLIITSISLNQYHATSSDSNINIISSSCTTTLYPDLCHSTLSDITQQEKLATQKDAIELTLFKTKDTIQASFHTITNLITTPNLTKPAKMALQDCLEMESATLEDLDTAMHYLKEYPTKKPLRQYADDLKTIMSTTITNKETCLDSLNSYHEDVRWLRELISQGQEHGGKMCSNVLAMIKDMTDTDIANFRHQYSKLRGGTRRRKLKGQGNNEIMWPEWLSAGDRKLLGFGMVRPNVIVSKNKKDGNYTTVQEAIDAAPSRSDKKYVIKIMAGTYKEYVHVSKGKHNIMLIGEGGGKTIITGNKNVAADDGTTTTKSATVG